MTRAARTLVRSSYRGPFMRGPLRRALSGTVTVLLYHRIAEHHDAPWLEASGLPCTSPKAFREHLQLLTELGAEFLTLDELDPQVKNGLEKRKSHSVARPRVVITFDDGFADNFEVAAPMLEEFQARGVFFITTSLPDKAVLLDHRLAWLNASEDGQRCLWQALEDRLRPVPIPVAGPLWAARQLLSPAEIETIVIEAERRIGPLQREQICPLYATWDQIAIAAKRGHQIGAHTVHHPMRYSLSAAEFTTELVESKQSLEAHLGCDIRAFSYPFNAYMFTDEAICRAAGFRQIATVDPGRLNYTGTLGKIPRRTAFCIHDSLSRFRELLLDQGFTE